MFGKVRKNNLAFTTSVYGFIDTGSGGFSAVAPGRQAFSTQQIQPRSGDRKQCGS